MAHKNRSLRKGSSKPVYIDFVGLYDEDVVGLYDELVPPWKLGSPDTTVPEWSREIFGGREHHPVASIHRPRHDLKHTA